MPILGITGGIATGKSTFTRSLLRHLPAEIFDADACARELIETDATIQQSVREVFGPEVFDLHGRPDRSALRARVFANETDRRQLESILHPAIRARWMARRESLATSRGWFCVDLPLLYETAAEALFDRVIVVACAPATQHARLRESRGLSETLAAQILAAQLDLRVKIAKADHLIWNDSTARALDEQAALLGGWLRKNYG